MAQKTSSLEMLYEVAASLNESYEIEELLTRFMHRLHEFIGSDAATARITTGDKQMRLIAGVGLDSEHRAHQPRLPMDECLPTPFAADGQRGNVIAVPLRHRNATLGVYTFFIAREKVANRPGLGDLLTSVGQHLGVAIQQARMDHDANRLVLMEERTRLANELHDSLAQTLASLRMQARVLDETLHQGDESVTWQEMEKIESMLDEAHTELRELIGRFRAPIDKDGLVSAIENAAARFRKETGVPIFLQNEWQGVEIDSESQLEATRIVQEALANIRKHGHAEAVRILLSRDKERFWVLIEDDGVGFHRSRLPENPGEHIGLTIMKERARKLGGELRIETEPGEGTRVILGFAGPTSGKVAGAS
ncbi:MAG: sensor histidine kinase [Gammaproteobacteria bacterium]